jgi:thiosulfate/3-mercaptopyruvate sulfurtransferase
MNYDTLISVDEAAGHSGDPAWLFVDCRYTLGDKGKGRRDYEAGHLPGALFASLDDDLASPHVPGKTGRHPLPEKQDWVATLSRWGIQKSTQVIAYDAGAGQSAAGRLWWLLKWAGHDQVAVLDGGIPAWQSAGWSLSMEYPSHRQGFRFEPAWRDEMQVSAAELSARMASGEVTVLDARAVERYRGEVEPIDPVAGHIPGAISAPFSANITTEGVMAPVSVLSARFGALAPGRRAEDVIVYCGSGVSAIQNLLAFAHAGRGIPRLYPGSWSEWVTDPARPVARGHNRD